MTGNKLNELVAENEKLKVSQSNAVGIRKVIQSGNKELVPKKFANVGQSGSFKSWAREVKDYARIADPETLELFKIGELTENKVDLQTDIPQQLENLDQDLHYFISRFLDGEAKLLSINADIGTFAKEHKSGAELWRLLVFNNEKKSAYTVVSVVEMIKNVEKAKSMMDIQPKIATLERLYIEFANGFNESDDADRKGAIGGLKHMATVGYFDVFKKSDLLRILPDNVIKDLRRSPDVKLETNSNETLRNIVNQLVKDSNNATAPMDLDALKEADNEGNSSEGDGAKIGSVEDSENVDDDNRFTVYGTDGCLYYLSMKGKGKSAGKGDSGKRSLFQWTLFLVRTVRTSCSRVSRLHCASAKRRSANSR